MKWLKRLIFWYLLFVIIKSILSYFVFAPSAFGDEYIHAKAARSIFYNLTFGSNYNGFWDEPLYPLIISISYIGKDMNLVFIFMKIINSIISSLVIFPVWLISKEFLTKRDSLKLAILVSLIPPMFSFSPYIMTENIFFPLFLFSVYLIYKSFTSVAYLWDILGGVFIGLTILSRMIGLILIPTIFLLWVISKQNKKNMPQFKKKCVLLSLLILTLSPWVYIKATTSPDFSIDDMIGKYALNTIKSIESQDQEYPYFRLITRFFIYLGYLILSSLTIFFLYSISIFKKAKENLNLFILSFLYFILLIFILIIGANHGNYALNISEIPGHFPYKWLGGRVIGRYIDAIIPLVFIIGSISFFGGNKISKKLLVLVSMVLIFSSTLTTISLFPVNNMSLTHLGVLIFLLKSLMQTKLLLVLFGIIFGVLPFIFVLIRNLDHEKLIKLSIVFFILLGLLNYSVISFNSFNSWYKQDQMQLGLWFNDFDNGKSVVLFDKNSIGDKIKRSDESILCDAHVCPMGFWMNNELIFGEPNDKIEADYIISKQNLDLPIVKEVNGIFIYRSI